MDRCTDEPRIGLCRTWFIGDKRPGTKRRHACVHQHQLTTTLPSSSPYLPCKVAGMMRMPRPTCSPSCTCTCTPALHARRRRSADEMMRMVLAPVPCVQARRAAHARSATATQINCRRLLLFFSVCVSGMSFLPLLLCHVHTHA